MRSLRSVYPPTILLLVTLLQGTSWLHAQDGLLAGTEVAKDTIAIPESQSIAWHGPVNFGNVNVCPAGQQSPKPCSYAPKVKYSATAMTTFGPVLVGTQGQSNLDFSLVSTTCTGTIPAGSTCTVKVSFRPLGAGVRLGGIQLTDSSGNVLTSTYLYGNGQGAVPAFNPGVQTNLAVSGYTGDAMAVDAAGNVYFAVGGNSIAKFNTITGVQTIVATGVPHAQYAEGMAVDGIGDIFVSGNGVTEIAAVSGIQSSVENDLNASAGIAVDGKGNLYVGDDWDTWKNKWGWPRLTEVSTHTGKEQTLLSGYIADDKGNPFVNFPFGVAVDGATNAYIACFNFGPVFESLANTPPESGGGVVASRQYTTVGNFGSPSAVTVDAAGDVFVVNGGIYEVQPGTGIETLVVDGPFGVQMALDAVGDLFFPNQSGDGMVEAEGSEPALLDFGSVPVGTTSAPQSITIQNIGNQPLNAVSPGLSISAQFAQVPGTGPFPDCTANFSLTPGAACNLSIVFAPKAKGTAIGTATFTDNALNNSQASQTATLQGTGK
jgi:Abnormal spindle-like microcephaly-assoc'd, ASPM-SPD-2-Hydin